MNADQALKIYEQIMGNGEDLFVAEQLQVDGEIMPLDEDTVFAVLNYIAQDQTTLVKDQIEAGTDGLDAFGAMVMCCVEYGMVLERAIQQEKETTV